MHILLKTVIAFYLSSLLLALFLHSGHMYDIAEKHRIPRFISVYRTETCTVTTVPFEKYVSCVVACEMPSSFHMEALKSQAVAARTYAAAKVSTAKAKGCSAEHPLAPVCDSTHCQVYRDCSDISQTADLDKITDAVESTKSQLLYYDGNLIMHALFHASSGGKTENSEDVFISAVPYLKSVGSPYESGYTRSGHGVGMSQRGADGMANAGYTYTEILSHYYTGTHVR